MAEGILRARRALMYVPGHDERKILKSAALGLDGAIVPKLKRASDGKSEALFFDSVATGATNTHSWAPAVSFFSRHS